MKYEANVCKLVNGLRSLRLALQPSASNPAMVTATTSKAVLTAQIAINEGAVHLNDFTPWERTPGQVSQIFRHLDNQRTDLALPMIDAMIEANLPWMPRFRIVLFNETSNWVDTKLVRAAGSIYAAYLYDENRQTHMADIRPSYELIHLYDTTENRLTNKMQALLNEASSDNQDITMYCTDVDKVDWRHKHFCGDPSDPDADSYQDLQASEVEYYRCNVAIDLPRPVDLQMVLRAVDQLLLSGNDLSAVTTLKTVANLSGLEDDRDGLLAAVVGYQRSHNIGDLRNVIAGLAEAQRHRHDSAKDCEAAASFSPS